MIADDVLGRSNLRVAVLACPFRRDFDCTEFKTFFAFVLRKVSIESLSSDLCVHGLSLSIFFPAS